MEELWNSRKWCGSPCYWQWPSPSSHVFTHDTSRQQQFEGQGCSSRWPFRCFSHNAQSLVQKTWRTAEGTVCQCKCGSLEDSWGATSTADLQDSLRWEIWWWRWVAKQGVLSSFRHGYTFWRARCRFRNRGDRIKSVPSIDQTARWHCWEWIRIPANRVAPFAFRLSPSGWSGYVRCPSGFSLLRKSEGLGIPFVQADGHRLSANRQADESSCGVLSRVHASRRWRAGAWGKARPLDQGVLAGNIRTLPRPDICQKNVIRNKQLASIVQPHLQNCRFRKYPWIVLAG